MAPFLLCASMRHRLWHWAVFVGKYVCCRSWTQPSAGELSVKTTEAPHGPGCLQQQEPGCRDTLKQTHILLTWLRLLLMSGSMSESTLVKVSGKSVDIIDQLSTFLKFFGTYRFAACRQNFFQVSSGLKGIHLRFTSKTPAAEMCFCRPSKLTK